MPGNPDGQDEALPPLVTLPPRVAPADVTGLCTTASSLLPGALELVVDVAAVQVADLAVIDVVARITRLGRRAGVAVRIRGASPDLRALLELTGLRQVLLAALLEDERQAEAGEESGVEEVVDVGHPPVAQFEDLDAPRLVPPRGAAGLVVGEGG